MGNLAWHSVDKGSRESCWCSGSKQSGEEYLATKWLLTRLDIHVVSKHAIHKLVLLLLLILTSKNY